MLSSTIALLLLLTQVKNLLLTHVCLSSLKGDIGKQRRRRSETDRELLKERSDPRLRCLLQSCTFKNVLEMSIYFVGCPFQ